MTRLWPGARIGLAAGAITVLASLIGMVEQFAKLHIVADALTMTDILLVALPAIAGALASRRASPGGRGEAISAALVAGVASAVPPALLVLVGRSWPLQAMFVNAGADLYDTLLWGRGYLALFGVDIAAGAAGGAVALLPGAVRRALVHAAVAVIALGAMAGLIRPILSLYRGIDVIWNTGTAVLGGDGITQLGTAVVFAFVFVVSLTGQPARDRFDQWLTSRSAAAQSGTRTFGRGAGVFVTVAGLLVLPFLIGSYPIEIVDKVGLFILMGLGLNIVVGFAGLLDLGYVAFYAIGAYTVGVLTAPFLGLELPFVVALPVAILAAIVAGVILGIPVLKTHGDYLAIITLGFGEIIRILAQSDVLKSWLGGAQGITRIPPSFTLGAFSLPVFGRVDPAPPQEVYYPILLFCLIAVYITWRLRYSRLGRAWLAVREDEEVAAGLGINLVGTKLLAFATGASLAGMSGALVATKVGSVFPASFGLIISINVLVLIILGGVGSIPGVFVGALVLVALPELLREFSDFRLLLYGAVLVVMMLTRPQGLRPASSASHEEADEPPPEPGAGAAT